MNALRIPGLSVLRLPAVRGAGGAFSLSLLARGIGLVNAVLLARFLQPAGYGLYSYAYAVMALLAIPAMFGIPIVVTREVAAADSRGRWDIARGVIRWAHTGVAIFSTAILALAGCYLALFASHDLTTAEITTYAIALVMVPVLALDALRGAILTGLRRVVLGQLPANLLRPSLMLVALFIAWWLRPELFSRPAHAIALLAASASLAYIIGGLILLSVRPRPLHTVKPSYQVRRWSISAIPIGLTSGMYLVNQYTGIVILGIVATKAEVGEYRIAILAADVIVIAARAVDAAFAPYYARHAAASNQSALQRSFTLSTRLVVLVALPVAVFYVLFGRQLLGLAFGPTYIAAWAPLMILAAGRLLNSMAGPVGTLLNMSGHERDVTIGLGISAVINVGLCLVLIPVWGANGAATASAISLVVWNVLLSERAWKRLSIIPGLLSTRSRVTDA